MEGTDPLPTKPVVLHEFVSRFLDWVNDAKLEEKTRKFYRNGWRLLKRGRPDHRRLRRAIEVSWLVCKCQLRFADTATNALYCARHDYGTRVLMRTGNLAAVMRTMGHREVKTAMHYQHPELEVVRAALDYRPPNSNVAA